MLNTLSVTTTPLISSATLMPITVTIGTAALRSACRTSTFDRRKPFRARRADIILVQHFQHAGARDAREQRDIDDRTA